MNRSLLIIAVNCNCDANHCTSRSRQPRATKKWYPQGSRGASFALWASAGVQKSRTGREISCQPQSAIDRGRERRSEGGNERSVTGMEGGGRARVRVVRGRGGRDDEGERLKSPGLLA